MVHHYANYRNTQSLPTQSINSRPVKAVNTYLPRLNAKATLPTKSKSRAQAKSQIRRLESRIAWYSSKLNKLPKSQSRSNRKRRTLEKKIMLLERRLNDL